MLIYLHVWLDFSISPHMSQPHFEASVRMKLTLPKVGIWSHSGLPKTQSLSQNISHWNILYTVGKVLKCRYPKWPCMSHLDIYNITYGWKKGRESNWQFDSWPLKVKNRPDPDVCRWSATHHWKALEESYNFASDLILIRGRSWELWAPKVPGVQTGAVSRLLLGSLWTKSHLDVSPVGERREYYMGEGGGFSRIWAVVGQVSSCCLWLVPIPKVIQNED
jgi:hypothetical protein